MIEGSYGESGHDEKCEWASEACGCDSRKLLRAEIAVATKELTRLSVEIVKAKRELDEARRVLEAAREQVKQSKRWSGGHGHDDYLMAAYHTEQAVAAHDAARAAGGGGDE